VQGLKVGGAVATFSVSRAKGRLYSDPITIQVRIVLFINNNIVVVAFFMSAHVYVRLLHR
jgi:hypothetical protein